jgi:predicted transcriptional regulator
MYKANLSFTQLNDYLEFMITNNLMVQNSGGGKEIYVAIGKGLDFLRRHSELVELFKS